MTLTFIKKIKKGNTTDYLIQQLQYIGDSPSIIMNMNNSELRLQRSFSKDLEIII